MFDVSCLNWTWAVTIHFPDPTSEFQERVLSPYLHIVQLPKRIFTVFTSLPLALLPALHFWCCISSHSFIHLLTFFIAYRYPGVLDARQVRVSKSRQGPWLMELQPRRRIHPLSLDLLLGLSFLLSSHGECEREFPVITQPVNVMQSHSDRIIYIYIYV